ncbi:unnamed protein product [Prorocentrum cordatum]|uniref:Galectin n=1 Tax=Prorocentrum cordatum TaxID=2364126 RepID=A0ABN9TDD0_9DINO|nr:unnamed protein product [Polarella glacialis]
MDVKILRGQANNVLFMECSSKFVDLVMALMRAPMGEIIGVISKEPTAVDGPLPGSLLCGSVASLQKRSELFNTKPAPPEHTNLEDLLEVDNANQPILFLHGCHCEGTANGKTVKVISRSNNWTSNAVFKLGDQQDFEVKMTMHDRTKNMMLGIAPRNISIHTAQLYTFDGYFLELGGPGKKSLPV